VHASRILMGLIGDALADPGHDPLPSPLSWTETDQGATLYITAPIGTPIAVNCEVRFAELQFEWTLEPSVISTRVQAIALNVPQEANLHMLTAKYVTDLRVVVTVGEQEFDEHGFVVWQPPLLDATIWTRTQQRALAPQGVTDSALRLAELSDGDRLMPDVSDVLLIPADLTRGEREVADEPLIMDGD